MVKAEKVAVTGVGVISPYGKGKHKFWNGIKNGASAIDDISGFDTSGCKYKKAGEVKWFDPVRYLGEKKSFYYSRATQFAIVASGMALKDAGIDHPISDKVTDSFGAVFGVSLGGVTKLMDFAHELDTDGPRLLLPLKFPSMTPNAPASNVAIEFNIKGFSATVLSEGFASFSYGIDMIRDGQYKTVLIGSSESVDFELLEGTSKLGCLSEAGPGRRERSAPYDARRNGLVLGEGACVFVLEELKHAKKEGRHIYAEVKGIGDAFDPRMSSGRGNGATKAMRAAIHNSGSTEDDIDYILGSANSTRFIDKIEANAVKRVFEKKKDIPVTSIKSMIGETFSMDGSFSLLAAIDSLKRGYIPPTINFSRNDKGIGLNIVKNKAVKRRSKNILINSLVINGFNSSMVVGPLN